MKIVLVFLVCGVACAAAEVGSRGIVPEEVVVARPKAVGPVPVAAKPKYQPVAPTRPAAVAGGSQLGVTIWRLRKPTAKDTSARLLVQGPSGDEEWVPERVASSASLRPGDRVRLTLESPEAGYLYVIDREKYVGGERSKPYLIFPTARTRGGDNRVMAGKLIEVPAQEDQPNFFTMERGRSNQIEEELTVLLTRTPLAGIEVSASAIELDRARVAEWEQLWGRGKVETFELTGGPGMAWTRTEQEAGASGSRLLTQQDPPPQTVYRVAGAKIGETVLVKVHLRYHGSAAAK